MSGQERMWHVPIGGDTDDAVKYGLTLKAKCGVVWVPVTADSADKRHEYPNCPDCHKPRSPRITDGPTYIYRCYDEVGALIYVGCSSVPKQRMEQHRANSWWF